MDFYLIIAEKAEWLLAYATTCYNVVIFFYQKYSLIMDPISNEIVALVRFIRCIYPFLSTLLLIYLPILLSGLG